MRLRARTVTRKSQKPRTQPGFCTRVAETYVLESSADASQDVISWKLESEVKPGLEPRHSHVCCEHSQWCLNLYSKHSPNRCVHKAMFGAAVRIPMSISDYLGLRPCSIPSSSFLLMWTLRGSKWSIKIGSLSPHVRDLYWFTGFWLHVRVLFVCCLSLPLCLKIYTYKKLCMCVYMFI